jgi:hypothetical protein
MTMSAATNTVQIEKLAPGQAVAIVEGARFDARFDATLRRWRVETGDGELFSVSAKLHSIGKLFGVPRAIVPGATPRPEAPIVIIEDAAAHRQARRILASMREFGFEQGGYWKDVRTMTESSMEDGYTYRVAGDPIFHTIGEVAQVQCSRAETIEAIAAVVDGRRADLPPRMWTLPDAVKVVAEALAADKRVVRTETGTLRIKGPVLPPDWDAAPADDDVVPF